MLERYGHGGDLLTASLSYGREAGDFIDFSSNMNPLGPPQAVYDVLRSAGDGKLLRCYPDPEVRELRSKLSAVYDIPPESILVSNGAAECIDLVIRVLNPACTALARPSFSEYEEAVAKIRGKVIDIPLYEEQDFTLQLSALEHSLAHADTVFLGHPNNPSGRLLPKSVTDYLDEMEDVYRLSKFPIKNVILDEAFIDFLPDEQGYSKIRQASARRNWFVIRSMTKFYSIPGIRLGFIVAHPDWISKMKEQQTHWSVNFLAQQMGAAVLDDCEFMRNTREWLQTEKPWLTARLEKLGLRVFPSDVNFLLLSLPQGLTSAVLQAEMGRNGVLIRDAARFKGLDSGYCRVAIRQREDNIRLIEQMERAVVLCKQKP